MSLENYGNSGAPLDATNTGLVPVDQAVWFPPQSGANSLQLPSPATPVGDFSFIVRATSADWISGGYPVLMSSKFSGQDGLELLITNVGNVTFKWGNTAAEIADSTIVVPFTDGITYWLKAELDADNGVGGNDTTFSWAADQEGIPTSWTQLGAVVTKAGTAVPTTGTVDLFVGTRSEADLPWNGTIAYASQINAGTPVFTFDAVTDLPTDPAATSFTASTGQTVTVNRGTSGPVTVLAPQPVLVNPDDTNAANRVSIPTNAAFQVATGENLMMLFVGQPANAPIVTGIMLRTGTTNSESTRIDSKSNGDVVGGIHDGSTVITRSENILPDFDSLVVAVVLDRTVNEFRYRIYDAAGLRSSSEISAVGFLSIDPTTDTRILQSVPGTFAAATFRKGVGGAPSDAELAVMADYLLTATA